MWHGGFILKLKQNGISGSLLKLFQNYLHNRKQRVVLNGSYSDFSIIESGGPHGSVLGPYYFSFISMILKETLSPILIFFADDTMFFSIVNDPVLSADYLNHDLDIIH